MSSALTIVVPVHNDADIIEESVNEFSKASKHWPFNAVRLILVENGSSDSSSEKVKSLVANQSNFSCKIHGVTGESAGIGYAYHRGILEAKKLGWANNEDWLMLTASDIPSGFSDVEQFTIALSQNPTSVYIGSKAHPKSKVERGFKRKLISTCFFIIRKLLLGTKIGDPQGVVFLSGAIAEKYIPFVEARNFFYTTELLFYIERNGEKVIELPVVYAGERRPSTVKILRHCTNVFASLIKLRRKNHKR